MAKPFSTETRNKGVWRSDLPAALFRNTGAQQKNGYMEAMLLTGRGRRGRVVRDDGETIVVSFYDTGEAETVARTSMSLQWRDA